MSRHASLVHTRAWLPRDPPTCVPNGDSCPVESTDPPVVPALRPVVMRYIYRAGREKLIRFSKARRLLARNKPARLPGCAQSKAPRAQQRTRAACLRYFSVQLTTQVSSALSRFFLLTKSNVQDSLSSASLQPSIRYAPPEASYAVVEAPLRQTIVHPQTAWAAPLRLRGGAALLTANAPLLQLRCAHTGGYGRRILPVAHLHGLNCLQHLTAIGLGEVGELRDGVHPYKVPRMQGGVSPTQPGRSEETKVVWQGSYAPLALPPVPSG
eukprot:scaffold1034_cov418-Prasinococcus_capsulatus_cf.AAC.4